MGSARQQRRGVHPPLYFLLLDGWTALMGESAYAARALSAGFAVLALAAVYAVGRHLFDRLTACTAVVILATSGFFDYYAREIRMYSLLLLLGTLSTWAFLRWLRRPAPLGATIYAASMAALLSTHYYAVFFLFVQGLYVLLTRSRWLTRWCLIAGGAFLLFAAWTPGLLAQMRAHFDGGLSPAQPTNWCTIAALASTLTGGVGWLYLLPWGLGRGLCRLRRYGRGVLLLLLWLVVMPTVALLINVWLPLFYHARYLIAILPAVVLLAGYGLRYVSWRPLACLLLVCLVAAQLFARQRSWPQKPDWKPTIERVTAARRPDEPSLMAIAPCSVESYYDRRFGLRDAATIDLSVRRYRASEVAHSLAPLETAPSVWVMMPTNRSEAWDAAWTLAAERGVAYRDGVELMIFYRFSQNSDTELSFRFGELLHYVGGRVDGRAVRSGGPLCVDVTLAALAPVEGRYSLGVHLVDGENQLVAQWDGGLGHWTPGERRNLSPCLDLPADLASGEYHLHLVVYDWATLERLPVLEGTQTGISWGDALIFAPVVVLDGP